jgi:RAT1-interacting protein
MLSLFPLFAKQEIFVGFRTPSGILTTTQSFKTIEIPRLIRGKRDAWDPTICLSWGAQFFTFLKSIVKTTSDGGAGDDHDDAGKNDDDGVDDDNAQVWRVSFQPHVGISAIALQKSEVADIRAGEDRVGFLPRWYYEQSRAGRASTAPDTTWPAAGLQNKQRDGKNMSDDVVTVASPAASQAQNIPKGWQI